MKNGFFTKIALGCLLFLITISAVSDINQASINQASLTEKKFPEKPDKSLQDPIEYVLGKLEHYDLVMIGEHHYTHELPIFIDNLIKRCYKTNAIDAVFVEFGEFEDQGKIDAFVMADEYNLKLLIEVLQNSSTLGWGYKEYFDIYKLIHEENKKRPPSEKIKLVLTDGPPDDIHIDKELYKCIENSQMQEKQKWRIVSWLREAITGRDLFMAEVIDYTFSNRNSKVFTMPVPPTLEKTCARKTMAEGSFLLAGYLLANIPVVYAV